LLLRKRPALLLPTLAIILMVNWSFASPASATNYDQDGRDTAVTTVDGSYAQVIGNSFNQGRVDLLLDHLILVVVVALRGAE
jgi:hypothetical protein